MYSVVYKYKMDYRYYYPHRGVFPVVDINIEANGDGVWFPAIVDTGAKKTLVSPEYCECIGLDLMSGNVQNCTTANGSQFRAYGHQVKVTILDKTFQTEIFFSELRLDRCLLGRDILEEMQIGLNESLSTLFLF